MDHLNITHYDFFSLKRHITLSFLQHKLMPRVELARMVIIACEDNHTYVGIPTALHTTVGPHLCCDNWKGQRLRVFYSIYRANEVFHV